TADLSGHHGTTAFADEVVRRTRTKLEVWAELSGSEPLGGHGIPAGDDLAGVERGEEAVDDLGVELRSGAALDLRCGDLGRERRAVRTPRRHRVECVRDGENPALEGNRGPGAARGIAERLPEL